MGKNPVRGNCGETCVMDFGLYSSFATADCDDDDGDDADDDGYFSWFSLVVEIPDIGCHPYCSL